MAVQIKHCRVEFGFKVSPYSNFTCQECTDKQLVVHLRVANKNVWLAAAFNERKMGWFYDTLQLIFTSCDVENCSKLLQGKHI